MEAGMHDRQTLDLDGPIRQADPELMGMEDVVMDEEKTAGHQPVIAPYRVRIELIENIEVPNPYDSDELIDGEKVTAATIFYEDGRPVHALVQDEDGDEVGVAFDFLDMVRDTARANGKRFELMGPQSEVAVRGYYG